MLGQLNTYFIREHVGAFKLTDTYDILNPETQEIIGVAKERTPGWIHLVRFFVDKKFLPTTVNVHNGPDPNTSPIAFSIKRGFTFLRSRVDVVDANGKPFGYFKSKLLSMGGAFRVYDCEDNEIAFVKGDWKGWNFKFLVGEEEFGTVTKKWAGMGKELFTTADQYIVNLDGEFSEVIGMLLLAAGLAIDIVYKE